MTAIRLYLLRHADAGDPARWEGPDAARPLSPKGVRQAERLALLLGSAGFKADEIVSSPKVRAVQTAEPVAAALGLVVRIDDRLAGGLDDAALAGVLSDAGNPDRVVIVGHDPDFSSLLSWLVGVELAMKKGAMARVDLSGGLAAGSAALRWLITPELLPG